ncbi:MAG: recombination mediator RecR [Porphyromonas sp.]|nr:recombination mediator RecR [Porphyromonas sp.]
MLMREGEYSSKLLEEAIEAFSTLPGIGRKSALRLALFLLRHEPDFTHQLTSQLNNFVDNIHHCKQCHNISDDELCSICADPRRDRRLLCVVESVREVIAIERTGYFNGLYHVLGGIISPIDGIGPDDLYISDLVERVKREEIEEVMLAFSATMEGDTTNFYIYRLLEPTNVLVSVIARGVAIGDELEYADDLTLGRSIEQRIDFSSTLRQ